MTEPRLFAWKFIVPGDQWYPDPDNPDNPNLSWKGIAAVAISATPEGARAAIEKFMVGDPGSPGIGWLRVAKVIQLPLVEGAFLTVASV